MSNADDLVAGRYRLRKRLGASGMAEVWAADDLELERPVAIKFLGAGADPARFEREARTAAALAHPNLVPIYDYGEADGRPFLALEYLPGGTLEEKLVAGAPLADAEAARIAREVADGLAHAHARGVVHRDLKPANILFDDVGLAKIADFGVAQFGAASTLTEPGTLLGTAAYLPPEQAAGAPATAASDVYSFGIVLYRMLSGRLPFEAEDPLEVARMHCDLEPPALAEVRPDAPPALAAVAMAALAKDPQERPKDGSALVAMLEGTGRPAFADADAPTVVTQVLAPPRRRRGRTPMLIGLAAVAALLLAGFALAFLVTRTNTNQPIRAGTKPHTSRASHTKTPSVDTRTQVASTQSSTQKTRTATTKARMQPPPTTAAQVPTTAPTPTTAPATTTAPPTTAATTAPTTDTTPPPTTATLPQTTPTAP